MRVSGQCHQLWCVSILCRSPVIYKMTIDGYCHTLTGGYTIMLVSIDVQQLCVSRLYIILYSHTGVGGDVKFYTDYVYHYDLTSKLLIIGNVNYYVIDK